MANAGELVRASGSRKSVRKTADQSVTSSTVLVNDLHLFRTIPEVGEYIFELRLFLTSAADNAGDFKYGFTFPGTLHFGQLAPAASSLGAGSVASGEWLPVLSAVSGVSTSGFGVSSFGVFACVQGILIASAPGTLRLQWAQSASSASATTVKAGSHMIVERTV